MSEPKQPDGRTEDRGHRSKSRFGRFAKLSSMTAGVAARQVRQKISAAFQDDEAQEAGRSKALAESARSVADGLGELKGAAMKIGQMLSMDSEILPKEVTDALSVLQSEAPSMAFSMVKDEVESSLNASLDDVFSEFSHTPIGSASIGQVHKAVTKAGASVAVKVQYPGIASTIDSDMKNLGSLLQLARAKIGKERVQQYVEEVTETIRNESDYLREADNLERFQTVLRSVPGVRAPLPHFDLCRQNVLVMDFVEGQRLADWMATAPLADRDEICTRLIRSYVSMMHDHQTLHADPHPGNLLIAPDGDIVFLDLGCVRDYPQTFCDGLVAVISSMWRHDTDALEIGLDACGFDHVGVDMELIYEWLCIVLKPLLSKGPFAFSDWQVHDDAVAFVKNNPSITNFHPPREGIFYLRVMAGLRGLINVNGLSLDVRHLARQEVKARGFSL